jgi:hypothetical protein
LEWKKILADHMFDKGLIFSIKNAYNITLKRKTQKTTQFLKLTNNYDIHFSKEDIKMLKSTYKMLAAMSCKEMQIKITMR